MTAGNRSCEKLGAKTAEKLMKYKLNEMRVYLNRKLKFCLIFTFIIYVKTILLNIINTTEVRG